jgi:hypothetical protein
MRLAFIDQCQSQRLDFLVNPAPGVDIDYRDVERGAEMCKPLMRQRVCDRQEIMEVLER